MFPEPPSRLYLTRTNPSGDKLMTTILQIDSSILGENSVRTVHAEGLALNEDARAAALSQAKAVIKALAA
jgi:FMN-dependent NADH-azoreductase